MITVGPGISIGNGITFQAEVLLDGLQLYLDAGNTTSYSGSGSAWNDLSGNGNDATLVNTPTFDPDNQGSLQFDGDDQYVDVNASLASETFTIAAWINTSASGINMIFSKEGTAGTPWNYRMWLNGGELRGDISTNLGGSREDDSVIFAGSLNNGAWHLVMFTRNTDSMTLYVDGEQAATAANTLTDPISNAQELWIGRSAFTAGGINPTGSYPYDGKIAQALVYNRVLDATEARQTYYATQGRYNVTIENTGLVLNLDAGNTLSYPGSGTTWFDLTSTQYNATLVNAPTLADGSFEFNGTDEYAEISHNSALKPTTAISMEQWLNADDWTAGTSVAYKTALSCTQGGGYAHYIWEGVFRSYVRANSTYQIPTADISALSGWHHFVTTFDGRYTRLYVDGVLADTVDIGSSGNSVQYAFNNSLLIAAEATATTGTDGFYWDGAISQTRLYNTALSAAAVKANYDTSRARYA